MSTGGLEQGAGSPCTSCIAADEFASLFLLENSADVNLTSEGSEGDTALHMAARSAEMAAVAGRLLERGARVNAQNRKNM